VDEQKQAPAQPNKPPSLSHKLYDRMGINIPLKAIDIFISVVAVLLVAAIIYGALA
jgi:hypothetical protein